MQASVNTLKAGLACVALRDAWGWRCRFLPGVCGGEPRRADVACWGGWGPHTRCAHKIGPHPPQPTPPSRHGSLRCVCGRRQKFGKPFSLWLHRFASLFASQPFLFSACPRIPVQAHTGSHGQGVSRSDNLCSQCAEDGSPLERAQGEAVPSSFGNPSAAAPPSSSDSLVTCGQ